MVTYQTNLKNLPKALRARAKADIEAVHRAAWKTCSRDAHRAIQWAIRSIDPKKRPVDTGDYERAWTAEKTEDGATFRSTATPAVKAGVIERGRRPAFIPIKPLSEWVRHRLGISDEKKAKSVAFAISVKAKRQKRPGLGIMKKAHPRIVAAFERNLQKELLGGGKKRGKK